MEKNGQLNNYFPLHDNWLLKGEEQEDLFEDVIPPQFQYANEDLELQKVYKQIKAFDTSPVDFVKKSMHEMFGMN